MAMFENFRGFEHLYDARVLTEDGHEFPFHRVLLAMRCEYFHKLLCNAPPEQTEFFIPEIKGSALEAILEYIYTGKLNFTANNITDILKAVDFLGIEQLLNSSRLFAISNLTTTNSVSLFLEGTKNEKLGVVKASSRFIEVNFEGVVRDYNSRFEDLTIESLKRILLADSLNVSDERQVWKAIERWVGSFPEDRKKYLRTLIPCIRFSEADGELLMEVSNHPLVKEDPSHISLMELACTNESIVPQHRLPQMLHLIIKSFINQSDYAEGIKIFVTYDENIDFWRKITTKIFRPDVILQGPGSFIVMCNTMENIICVFDVLSKTWTSLNPLTIPRWNYNVVNVGNHIYAIGGISPDGEIDEMITTLERYNFDSEEWELAASHFAFIEGAAATVDNKIFVIGMPDFHSEVLSAQVYDPETNVWRTIEAPKVYRRLFTLAVYQEKLFILGGQNNEEHLTSVEVYDTRTRIWRDFENLPFSYVLPKAVTIKDVLYVYDNYSDEIRDFRWPTVLWDETSLEWKVVEASSPFCELHIYKFCSIRDSAVIKEMKKENRDRSTRWVESPFFIHLNS